MLDANVPAEAADPVVPVYPGAREPDRFRRVPSLGVSIHVAEWGDPDATPVLLCHGFWDHVRSFALLAPLLARRYRVVAMDARGHGDSDRNPAHLAYCPTQLVDDLEVLAGQARPVLVFADHAPVAGLVVGRQMAAQAEQRHRCEIVDPPLRARRQCWGHGSGPRCRDAMPPPGPQRRQAHSRLSSISSPRLS